MRRSRRLDASLDEPALEEGIGRNSFDAYCDHVHPNPRTNALIADAVFEKIEELRISAHRR